MKEELKESPLKKDIDDIMLEGAFEGAYLTDRYAMIQRIDGFGGQHYEIRTKANKLAEKKGGDGVVASGIATAILDSIVIYGEIGKKFLQEKLQQEGETFSQIEYTKDVAKSITSLYQYDRKEKIINGVVDALNDAPNNVEANAAKTAIMQNEYWNEYRLPEVDVLEERFLSGNIISSEKIYRRLECMHHQSVLDEQALKNLNIVYEFLQKNPEIVSKNIKE